LVQPKNAHEAQVARITFIKICSTQLLRKFLENMKSKDDTVSDAAVILRSKRYVDGDHIVVIGKEEDGGDILGWKYKAHADAERIVREQAALLKQPIRTPAWRVVHDARTIVQIWLDGLNEKKTDDSEEEDDQTDVTAEEDREARIEGLLIALTSTLEKKVNAALEGRTFEDPKTAIDTARVLTLRLGFDDEMMNHWSVGAKQLNIIKPPSLRNVVARAMERLKERAEGGETPEETPDA
jgi:hypothetical protein